MTADWNLAQVNVGRLRAPVDDVLLAINMSVWRSAEDLADYVYRSDHVGFMRRRREWLDRFDGHYLALWWIPAGTVPTVEGAMDRLGRLEQDGPTAFAFTFRHRFDPPGRGGRASTGDDHRRDACPA